MDEILVDYFLRELEGKTISESIKYLEDIPDTLEEYVNCYPYREDCSSLQEEIEADWKEYLTNIKEEYKKQEYLGFCALQDSIIRQIEVAWDFHDIAEKGNSYTIWKACRQMAEEQQDREAAYEWVYYKNLLPVKSYPVFTKWAIYFWSMYYTNYTI